MSLLFPFPSTQENVNCPWFQSVSNGVHWFNQQPVSKHLCSEPMGNNRNTMLLRPPIYPKWLLQLLWRRRLLMKQLMSNSVQYNVNVTHVPGAKGLREARYWYEIVKWTNVLTEVRLQLNLEVWGKSHDMWRIVSRKQLNHDTNRLEASGFDTIFAWAKNVALYWTFISSTHIDTKC